MKHCGYCGRQIDRDMKFCPHCGKQLEPADPGQGASAAKKSSRAAKVSKPPKKRLWIAAIAAALVVCLGAGGLLFRQKMRSSSIRGSVDYDFDSDIITSFGINKDGKESTIIERLASVDKAMADDLRYYNERCYYTKTNKERTHSEDGLDYARGELLVSYKNVPTHEQAIKKANDYGATLTGFVASTGHSQWYFPEDFDLHAAYQKIQQISKDPEIARISLNGISRNTNDISYFSNIELSDYSTAIRNSSAEIQAKLRHGTHVAGIIGAVYRNDDGLDGAFPLAYDRERHNRFLYAIAREDSSTQGLITYLDIMFSNGVTIFNFSMNSGGSSEEIESSVTTYVENREAQSAYVAEYLKGILQHGCYGDSQDFLIVTSAGNEKYNKGVIKPIFKALDCRYNNEFTAISPSEYKEVYNRIIVVGNCNQKKKLCMDSYGGDRMDLAAVGKDIRSIVPDSQEPFAMSGTSMSTPYVTGTAAMAWTLAPQWTGEELKNNIIGVSTIVTNRITRKSLLVLNAAAIVNLAAGTSDGKTPVPSLEPINTPQSTPDNTSSPTSDSIFVPKHTDPPEVKTDYTAIFQAKLDELVDRYGAMAGEPQVKTVGEEYSWMPIWTSHESEGMLFGDIFDYDADGAPELLTMRNAPGQGDSSFFDLLTLETYEAKDGSCVLSDAVNISAEGLSIGGWAGTGISAFRYSLNGVPAIGVLCETDSGSDWVVVTLSYGYTGDLLLMNNGVKYGSWPGAYAEEGEEGGYLSACFEAASERSALYTSANGDTFEHWKVAANSGLNFYDAQVNDMYWKCLGKIGLAPRDGGALSDRLLQEGRFLETPVEDHIRYHNAADSLEALAGDLTMLGNITNEYFIESDIYFARDYLYEDMQEFIATGNLANGSGGAEDGIAIEYRVDTRPKTEPIFRLDPESFDTPEPSADDSEAALRKKVLEAYSGSGDIQGFGYSDFDWDGRHEAFALIGVYNDSTWENTCELWFVSADTCTRLEKDKGYYPSESAIVKEGGYNCFSVSEGYFGSGSTLRLWTVLDGQPVLYSQSEYAGQSGEVFREVYLSPNGANRNDNSGDSRDGGHGGTVSMREAGQKSNIRTGPGLDYDTMGVLTGGMDLDFLNETSIDGRGVTWYKVSFEGSEGWVSEKYTKFSTH